LVAGRTLSGLSDEPACGRFGTISAIYVLKLQTGELSQIALGESPSWSPSGEWIAFAGYVQLKDDQLQPGDSIVYSGRYYCTSCHQFRLVSPSGTHTRVLMTFHSGVVDNAVPVWSPDSRTLLLTTVRDPDNGTLDIYQFDLASSKRTKRFSNTVSEVYGWIDARTVDSR
jgi:Tol biopolymer transport system component